MLDAVRGAAVHVLRTGSMQVPAARACVAGGPPNAMEMTEIKHLGSSLQLTAMMHVEGICARVAQTQPSDN